MKTLAFAGALRKLADWIDPRPDPTLEPERPYLPTAADLAEYAAWSAADPGDHRDPWPDLCPRDFGSSCPACDQSDRDELAYLEAAALDFERAEAGRAWYADMVRGAGYEGGGL